MVGPASMSDDVTGGSAVTRSLCFPVVCGASGCLVVVLVVEVVWMCWRWDVVTLRVPELVWSGVTSVGRWMPGDGGAAPVVVLWGGERAVEVCRPRLEAVVEDGAYAKVVWVGGAVVELLAVLLNPEEEVAAGRGGGVVLVLVEALEVCSSVNCDLSVTESAVEVRRTSVDTADAPVGEVFWPAVLPLTVGGAVVRVKSSL